MSTDGQVAGRAPIYARLLRLRRIKITGLMSFLLLECTVAVAILLALAELVSWWAVPLLPVLVAVMVKVNDMVGGPAKAPVAAAAAGTRASRVPPQRDEASTPFFDEEPPREAPPARREEVLHDEPLHDDPDFGDDFGDAREQVRAERPSVERERVEVRTGGWTVDRPTEEIALPAALTGRPRQRQAASDRIAMEHAATTEFQMITDEPPAEHGYSQDHSRAAQAVNEAYAAYTSSDNAYGARSAREVYETHEFPGVRDTSDGYAREVYETQEFPGVRDTADAYSGQAQGSYAPSAAGEYGSGQAGYAEYSASEHAESEVAYGHSHGDAAHGYGAHAYPADERTRYEAGQTPREHHAHGYVAEDQAARDHGYAAYSAAGYTSGEHASHGYGAGEHGYTAAEHGYAAGEHGYAAGEHGYAAGEHGYAAAEHGYAAAEHAERGYAAAETGYAAAEHGYAAAEHGEHGYAASEHVAHGYAATEAAYASGEHSVPGYATHEPAAREHTANPYTTGEYTHEREHTARTHDSREHAAVHRHAASEHAYEHDAAYGYPEREYTGNQRAAAYEQVSRDTSNSGRHAAMAPDHAAAQRRAARAGDRAHAPEPVWPAEAATGNAWSMAETVPAVPVVSPAHAARDAGLREAGAHGAGAHGAGAHGAGAHGAGAHGARDAGAHGAGIHGARDAGTHGAWDVGARGLRDVAAHGIPADAPASTAQAPAQAAPAARSTATGSLAAAGSALTARGRSVSEPAARPTDRPRVAATPPRTAPAQAADNDGSQPVRQGSHAASYWSRVAAGQGPGTPTARPEGGIPPNLPGAAAPRRAQLFGAAVRRSMAAQAQQIGMNALGGTTRGASTRRSRGSTPEAGRHSRAEGNGSGRQTVRFNDRGFGRLRDA